MSITLAPVEPNISLDDLLPLEQFAAAHSHVLTMATLRWHARNRDSNGLGSAFVRVGKKLFISRSRYEAWLSTRAGVAA